MTANGFVFLTFCTTVFVAAFVMLLAFLEGRTREVWRELWRWMLTVLVLVWFTYWFWAVNVPMHRCV